MANRHEMEEQITQLKRDLERATLEGETLRAKLEVYTGKEQAMAQALTEATASASRIRASAQEEIEKLREESRSLVENARKEADQLRKKSFVDADNIIADATNKANQIISAAKEEAEARLSKANKAVAEGEARLHKLNSLLSDMVQQTRSQAYALNVTAASGTITEPKKPAPTPLPQEYATPAELMHGIYQLQGRDTPAKADTAEEPVAPAPAEEPEAPAPYTPAYAAAPIKQDTPDAADEIMDAAEVDDPKVWTVDEIISQADSQAEKADVGSDTSSELDDLLNEILKD